MCARENQLDFMKSNRFSRSVLAFLGMSSLFLNSPRFAPGFLVFLETSLFFLDMSKCLGLIGITSLFSRCLRFSKMLGKIIQKCPSADHQKNVTLKRISRNVAEKRFQNPKIPNEIKNVQILLNASECIRMHPNGSKWIQTHLKNSKTCENV